MDDEVIEAFADALNAQLQRAITVQWEPNARIAILAVLDDIQAIAIVVNSFQPTYDLRYFYRRAGYPEPYPEHDII